MPKDMTVTGHGSKNGVRMYKEISHDQQEKMSDMIQPTEKRKIEDTQNASCRDSVSSAVSVTNSGSVLSIYSLLRDLS